MSKEQCNDIFLQLLKKYSDTFDAIEFLDKMATDFQARANDIKLLSQVARRVFVSSLIGSIMFLFCWFSNVINLFGFSEIHDALLKYDIYLIWAMGLLIILTFAFAFIFLFIKKNFFSSRSCVMLTVYFLQLDYALLCLSGPVPIFFFGGGFVVLTLMSLVMDRYFGYTKSYHRWLFFSYQARNLAFFIGNRRNISAQETLQVKIDELEECQRLCEGWIRMRNTDILLDHQFFMNAIEKRL